MEPLSLDRMCEKLWTLPCASEELCSVGPESAEAFNCLGPVSGPSFVDDADYGNRLRRRARPRTVALSADLPPLNAQSRSFRTNFLAEPRSGSGEGAVLSIYSYKPDSMLASLQQDLAGSADDVTFSLSCLPGNRASSMLVSNTAYAYADASPQLLHCATGFRYEAKSLPRLQLGQRPIKARHIASLRSGRALELSRSIADIAFPFTSRLFRSPARTFNFFKIMPHHRKALSQPHARSHPRQRQQCSMFQTR
jgi:hypothetical protein